MCELTIIVINKYQYVPMVHRDRKMIHKSGSRERPKRTTSAWCLWINYLMLSHMNNSGFGEQDEAWRGKSLREARTGKWNCLLIYRQYSEICTFSIFLQEIHAILDFLIFFLCICYADKWWISYLWYYS